MQSENIEGTLLYRSSFGNENNNDTPGNYFSSLVDAGVKYSEIKICKNTDVWTLSVIPVKKICRYPSLILRK